MKKKLAFVLGGGGSRGAMQAGALRALVESGYQPDLVCGTSIGAINGALMAVHGFTSEGVQKLEQVWKATVDQDLLPTNLWRETMRAFFSRSKVPLQQRILDFAAANGLNPELRLRIIQGIGLYPVAADLNTGQPVVFGQDPEELVLESVLASMALPPWFSPQEKDGQYLVDGGAVSTLPIETALHQCATEIIALDLFNPVDLEQNASGLGPLLVKLDKAVENRQIQLEMELAEARHVPVRRIQLITEDPVKIWDFTRSVELIECGYQLARQEMASWPGKESRFSWTGLDLKAAMEGLRKYIK